MKSKILLLSALLFVMAGMILSSCETKKEKKHEKKEKEKEKEKTEKAAIVTPDVKDAKEKETGNDCDTTFYWKYVYNPERLTVLEKCKTVTGVIEESNADEDGDQHMLLKLDAGQEGLLTKMNKKKKEGDLVIEAVCANNVKLKKVGETCDGYINKIQIPNVGTHVRVTGSLVNDTHNGWNEIHPITKMEILP